VKPEPLAEVEGNFNPIEAVTYSDLAVPIVASADEDGDTGTNEPTNESTETAPSAGNAPNIRRNADREGSAGVNSNRAVPKAEPVRRAPFFNRGATPDKPASPASPKGNLFQRLFRQ